MQAVESRIKRRNYATKLSSGSDPVQEFETRDIDCGKVDF